MNEKILIETLESIQAIIFGRVHVSGTDRLILRTIRETLEKVKLV